jgi:hydroxypyruvate reductase
MIEVTDRERIADTQARTTVLDALLAGIEATNPERVIEAQVSVTDGQLRVGETSYDLYPFREIIVLGGGNAAAHVARALERELGDHLDGGIVVTDDPVETDRVTVLPGDHPVPSEQGVESTGALLDRAESVGEDTLVLGVITGGGSALMPAPAAGISLSDLEATTDALLRSGATIHEINAVRKHLSTLKGGQLAATLVPATTVALFLSDVVGNDLDVIASGPLVPDSSTFADAQSVIERFGLDLPASVRDRIQAGVAGEISETPKPGDPAFDRVSTHIIADGYTALEAARDEAQQRGYDTVILSSRIEGEARHVGTVHAGIANEILATGNPVDPPVVVLSGGETTVSVSGEGSGGPNQEFAVAAALQADGDTTIGAVDSDGIDGASEAAGALLEPADIDDHEDRAALDANDTGAYLEDRGAQILTGPTGTNVNDLRVMLVQSPEGE